jgi:hypothetical protein
MNQQKVQSYINLIQLLLSTPSGEEWILLRQNESLVTPELVQVMEQVAAQLANQGNLKEAKFLHNLAGQIHHLFTAPPIPQSHDEDHSQACLELIKAILDCPPGSEGELLAAHQELIGPGLVYQMQQVSAQLAANGDQQAADYLQHWAMEINRLWLQSHDFQPILKKDSAPAPVAASSIASPVKLPQNIPLSSAGTNEDLWAETSEPAVQTSTLPVPPPNISVPNSKSAQDIVLDRSIDRSVLDSSIYEQINHYLETIAGALNSLCATSAAHTPPVNPLWYMEVLEHAYTKDWVLTSTEIQQLIGVQPICPKGSESFQRGCWVFVKAGKLGTQTAWRVEKDEHKVHSKEVLKRPAIPTVSQ